MANIFNINDRSILATASITITDQTDAATLAGGLSVIQGSKNQVYLTGSSTPFSPDWTKQNLVIRPYLYATTITRATGSTNEYNPDLFDPIEYPDLSHPGDINVTTGYINDLFWYMRDANGTESIINPELNSNFSYLHTVNGIVFKDKRFLVIKNNFIAKDSFCTLICRFSYYDPFAKTFIKQNYEIDLSCLSTGLGANQLVLNAVDGTSIYNSFPTYIDLQASFFKNGVELDIQDEIESGEKSSSLYWYIRDTSGDGWILLDGTKQKDYADLFEIRRHTSFSSETNRYQTEITENNRGGFCLRIKPGLIDGSNVIKAVYSSSDDNSSYNALEVIFDTTDDIQAYIHSSNGDKIYQGMASLGTTLTCMLKYQGKLMDTDDPRYENNFDYYWFKISSDGTKTWNVWLNEEGKMLTQEFKTDENIDLVPYGRVLPITADNVDNVNMFQCAVIDKFANEIEEQRDKLILNSPTEEDLIAANLLNLELGIENDANELLNTAYEINAANIANKDSFED